MREPLYGRGDQHWIYPYIQNDGYLPSKLGQVSNLDYRGKHGLLQTHFLLFRAFEFEAISQFAYKLDSEEYLGP